MGDVILSTGLLESIHKAYPDVQIDILIKQGYESLFEGHPFIRWVYVWDKKAKKYKNLLALLFTIRNNRYDWVVNLQRFASTGLLTAFSRAEVSSGFNKNPFSVFFTHRIRHTIKRGDVHEIQRNFRLIAAMSGVELSNPRLYPTVQSYARLLQYKTQAYICVAPASLWYTKQYPVGKWIEFINAISPDFFVYLLGSTQEVSLCDEIARQSTRINVMNLAGKLSLLDVAALMRDAIMNYVNDSAPMHLASSVNAPTTAVFCSTIPAFGFGPLSDVSYIIQNKEALLCRPCGLHGHMACPEKHFDCANGIRKEQLLNTLETNENEL